MSTDPAHLPARHGARWRPAWLLPVITGVVGAIGGAAVASGPAPDPTSSPQYLSLKSELASVRQELSAANTKRDHALHDVEVWADRAEAAENKASELDDREAAVAQREAAATAAEQEVAASTIRQGTWTVGLDVAAGTYRTAEPVGGDCYWSIYRSGTNKDEIIQNDIVTGGTPTVTLSDGQDFETNRCGTWVKQ